MTEQILRPWGRYDDLYFFEEVVIEVPPNDLTVDDPRYSRYAHCVICRHPYDGHHLIHGRKVTPREMDHCRCCSTATGALAVVTAARQDAINLYMYTPKWREPTSVPAPFIDVTPVPPQRLLAPPVDVV